MVWTELVEDEIVEAEEAAKESHQEAMNSYGAGYSMGYLEGLKMALVLAAEGNLNAFEVVPATERSLPLKSVDVEVEEG